MRYPIYLLSALICLCCLGCQTYLVRTDPISPNTGGAYHSPGDDSEDSAPYYSCDVDGEWEGWLYEDSRSDNLGLGEKTVAMRSQWTGTDWEYGVRHEWVEIDLLIDGRPTAYLETEVGPGGYIYFTSQNEDIDIEMEGWFADDQGSGWIDLSWDEKVELPDSDKVDMHYVELTGDFELDRTRSSQWASAWKLFNTYKDGVFQLGDNVWKQASADGLNHLAQLKQAKLRK
jgi:hypothetical protein